MTKPQRSLGVATFTKKNYHPTLSESYKIINASDAWNAAGGRATAGAGIKIGDIDSGIDHTDPFFDPTGSSYPPGFPKCEAADSASRHEDQDCNYVSPKVIEDGMDVLNLSLGGSYHGNNDLLARFMADLLTKRGGGGNRTRE